MRLSNKHAPSPTGSPAPTYTSSSQTASPQQTPSQPSNPVLFDAGESLENNVDNDTVAVGIPHDDDKDSNHE
jgi:hypothetical protein